MPAGTTPAHLTLPPRRLVMLVVAWPVLVFLSASAFLFVWPRSDHPARAGAILVLNGPDNAARARLGMELAREGVAPVLMYSQGAYQPSRYAPYCPRLPAVTVVCFVPSPPRTVGEIDFAARYAAAHGIGSLLVVAGRAQSARARML
ncbi:MAG TPA: hypothetical protein VKI19_14415, partial [Acidimicrobiales bacterium]|nr:hypothetical protein [Acidimicrobiales bacterium]